jgi:hypothetical protein
MLQKLKASIQVLGMGARYMGHSLYRATHATMLALARAFASLLLHWAKIAFLAIGIVIGQFGPGLYDQYAPWAVDPAATKNHDWVGMAVSSHPTVWTLAACIAWFCAGVTRDNALHVLSMSKSSDGMSSL